MKTNTNSVSKINIINATKITSQIQTSSFHFPAKANAIEQWNAINNSINIIIENIPDDYSPEELIGLLYRISGTLHKYNKKLLSFQEVPNNWENIEMNLNQYINYYLQNYSDQIAHETLVNPDQFVFDLAKEKLKNVLQLKEEYKVKELPISDEIKRLFFECDQLFRVVFHLK